MNWNELSTTDQLTTIDNESQTQPVMILKHSTRCSISAMALNRLERKWSDHAKLKPYYLDLIAYRGVSDEIERRYGVTHESPQVLIIKGGKCVYHNSHAGISYEELDTFAA